MFTVRPTSYGGRGCFATAPIAEGTVVHRAPAPFTSAVNRDFRKEVCAYCFHYDLGRTMKVRFPRASLWFCSDDCRANWVAHEDDVCRGLVSDVLERIDNAVAKARKTMQLGRGIAEPSAEYDVDYVPDDVILDGSPESADEIEQVWQTIAQRIEPAAPAASNPLKNPLLKVRLLALEEIEWDSARLVAVALVRKYLEEEEESTAAESRKLPDHFLWSKFYSLESHEVDLLARVPALLESHVRVFLFLLAVMPPALLPHVTIANVRAVVSREAANAFGIWQLPLSSESEFLGSAIFPSGSYFNHSCEPNVAKSRVGRSMHFTTTRDIAPDEELCISYGMMLDQPVDSRRETLKEQWYFDCGCVRCARELAEANSSNSSG
ncbi:hypothetical protein BZA70DRAFT_297518 [Myxozyma melibiosi]|uniref:SET domain-containing protein n=1 Tax=Myxozyma melibiosi TaxID=54550 RepID=A0ABR1EZI7_9ASCO